MNHFFNTIQIIYNIHLIIIILRSLDKVLPAGKKCVDDYFDNVFPPLKIYFKFIFQKHDIVCDYIFQKMDIVRDCINQQYYKLMSLRSRDGRTALMTQSILGWSGAVQYTLSLYPNTALSPTDIVAAINCKDDYDNTALIYASAFGRTEIVRMLIQALLNANADIPLALNNANIGGGTALANASCNGHTETVRMLIQAFQIANADIQLNHVDDEAIHATLLNTANPGREEIVKLLLLHGANLANAFPHEISDLIACNSNPIISQQKLLSLIQNGDTSWVSTDFSDISRKNDNEKNMLRDLASWGVIVGSKEFVTNMINLRQDTLPLAERTEYLRLALQSHKFDVADIILNNPTNKQSMLNYMLYLMVVEHCHLSIIQFLLDRGAKPQENIQTTGLFSDHTKLQEQHLENNMNTLQSYPIDKTKVDYRKILSQNNITLFHVASGSGKHHALRAICKSLQSGPA